MDKSDDARENLIRSGFLNTDTEAYTHRKHVSRTHTHTHTHTHTQKARLTAREYSLASRENYT